MKIFRGKKAIVTGGTRGIGKAIARKLLQGGASVMITGTSDKPPFSKKYDYYAVDFTDNNAVHGFLEKLRSGKFNILINNAGINKIGPFESYGIKDFEKIQHVNVTVPFQICQAVIPDMKRRKWGRIVNISSVWGKISRAERAAYSSSKFALDGLTAALAAEVAKYGILANCVAPGIIKTDLTLNILGNKGISSLERMIPVGRLGTVDEIACFVCWLASPENTYISGQNISIDGGLSRV